MSFFLFRLCSLGRHIVTTSYVPVLILIFGPQNFSNVIVTQVRLPFKIGRMNKNKCFVKHKLKFFNGFQKNVFFFFHFYNCERVCWCYFFMTALNSSPEMTPSPFWSNPVGKTFSQIGIVLNPKRVKHHLKHLGWGAARCWAKTIFWIKMYAFHFCHLGMPS